MTVAQTTAMNLLTGGTPAANGTLVLSTNEQEWAFTSDTVYGDPILQLIASAAWYFATQTSGPYTLVPANIPKLIPISLAGQSVFVKSVAATPTLYSSTAGMNPGFAAFSILTGVTFASPTFSGTVTMADATDIAVDTSTGTKIGTGATQKLAFWNATPIVQPANTVDYVTMFVNLGLRASGGTAAATFPGALSCAALTATSVAATGTVALTDNMTITEAKNIVLGTSTGSKIGTATGQKLGFWNAAPVAQQVLATGAAKTADDIITLLQTLGLCKQS